jgi:hypothetical protein
MKILGKCVHGSRLYDLHGDSSDFDFKSIFLPDVKECLLMRATKNETKKIVEENSEYESFALQVFLRLCQNSEDITVAMLHADGDKVLFDSDIYKHLRENRSKFYTKRMIGSLGYARSMTLKYGFRADRMKAVEKVLEVLKLAESKGVGKLYQCWDDLPDGEFIYRGNDERNNHKDNRYYEVAGKKLQATIAVTYGLEIMNKLYEGYGDRVKIAKNMGGHDYKALSHSFRVGYQLYEIYKNGGFSYPLPQSQFIKDVKYGKYDLVEENLDVKLNDLITEVERLALAADLPEKISQNWLDSIVLGAYGVESNL